MKKAYLSIGALLTVLAISGCSPTKTDSSTSEASSQSSEASSQSSEASSSASSSSSQSSSKEDVFNYELAVTAPVKTVYEVGETLDFAAITVTLTTYKNASKDGEETLARDKYVVSVNGQTVEGNFIFSKVGEVTFEVSSADHSEAKSSFSVSVTQHFTITNGSSDKVVLTSLPENAEEGDTVAFGLTLLPGYYFEGSLRIVDSEGNSIDYTDDGAYNYTFTMPASNVVITVTTDLNDFTIAKDDELIGNVVLESAENDDKAVYSAVAGTELKFKGIEDHLDYVIDNVFIDGVEVTKGDDGYYHFTMPHHPTTISVAKSPRDYEIVTNSDELELTTVSMYKDTETKEEILAAHKGETVYLKLNYEVKLVKYSVSVKDLSGNSLEVSQDPTDPTLYSFTMISDDISIEIKEDDWSKYAGYFVTDKTFKGTYTYASSSSTYVKEYTYDKLSSHTFVFDGNGKGKYDSYDLTWNTLSDASANEGALTFDYNSAYSSFEDCEFFYNSHLFVTRSSYKSTTSSSASKFTDGLTIGTWDENVTVHSLTLNKTIIVWAEDSNGDISEKILATPDNIYTSFGIYTDETKSTLITKGADITTTLNAYVEASSDYKFEITNGKFTKSYELSATEDESYSIVFKDEEGNVVTSAKNGTKVYMYATLSEAASEAGIAIKAPVVKHGSYTVSTTAVTGEENAWYFTMPEENVTASLTLKDDNKLKGHVAVGTYVGFNLYSSNNTDRDFSKDTKTTYKLNLDGTFYEGTNEFDVTSYDTGAEGTFTAESGYQTKTWNYDGKSIVRPYSSSSNDVYIAAKLGDGMDAKEVKTHTHWMNGSSWAIEFYHTATDGTVTSLASVFMTNNTFYMGVSFEMTGDSTSVGSSATYNVTKNGETIFTVANDTVTEVE